MKEQLEEDVMGLNEDKKKREKEEREKKKEEEAEWKWKEIEESKRIAEERKVVTD